MLHISVPGKPSGAYTEVDSSESDGETEPAESFHRRISTNKEIKCSVSNGRGVLIGEGVARACVLPAKGRIMNTFTTKRIAKAYGWGCLYLLTVRKGYSLLTNSCGYVEWAVAVISGRHPPSPSFPSLPFPPPSVR